MADDNKAQIVLDGEISPLRQKLREAGNDFKKFGTEGETALGKLTGPLAALQSKFIAIGALLAGGAVFKEAVAQTALFTEESTKLARALGISASEASILREALEQGNTSQEEFVGASKGLAKQVRTNEEALQAMGLKTRDAAGELRPLTDLTLEAIGVLTSYKQGTDRAIAGQVLFGKGFEMTSNLAEVNKQAVLEVGEQMQSLGMIASAESVAAWQAYDDASDKATTTLKAMKTTIGNALMPVLTVLANWFSAIGPAGVVVIRGALGGLISLFWGLKTAATIAFQLINASVVQLTEPIRAVSVAFWKLIHGDFEGAKSEIANIPKVWSQTWDGAFDTIVESATEARDKMWALFAEGTPTAAPGTGGNGAGDLVKPPAKDKKAPEEKSFMALYEAQLAQRKNLYEQENVLRLFSKEQELAYWQDLLARYDLTARDRLAITKKTADLELDIRRKAAKDQRDLDSFMVDHKRSEALAQVQYDETVARNAQENGELTKRQLLEQEENFARRRFMIEYQAAMQRLELLKTDPTASPVALAQAKEQMLEIERKYQMDRLDLGQRKKQEDNSFGALFEDGEAAFKNMATGILSGAQTLQQGLAGIFRSIYSSFVDNLISKPLGEWIAGQARMLAVKMGFLAKEKALQATSAATTVGIKTVETTAVVAADAAQAGAGAAASQASIPFAGPALALAAMASVFAAVMALGNRKSAARGYDIPRGLNPMVQTHEEEMILPQKYANIIRDMAGQGGQGAAPAAPGPVRLELHPEAMRYTLGEWLQGELARLAATRGGR